jgi:hypothetical protein
MPSLKGNLREINYQLKVKQEAVKKISIISNAGEYSGQAM